MLVTRRATLALTLATTLFGAASAQAADYTLRIHTLVKSPHPYNDMAEFMKTELEARSGDKIAVKIFDSGQLGQDPAVIGEVGLGTVDIMISTASNAAGEIPELAIFTMPYLFTGMDEALATIQPGTPVQAYFEKVFADRGTGLKLLALGVSGTRNLSTTDKAVTEPSDLEGMRMRTTQSPMDAETWSALGMLPVSVAWGELYAAMQTGVADAMESSLPGYTGSKLYEVAPMLSLTEHTVQVNHISISDRTWAKLPDDLQAIVLETATEANTYGAEKAKGYDLALVETLKNDHGVTVSIPNKEVFIAKLEPIQADLAERLDLVDEYNLLKGK